MIRGETITLTQSVMINVKVDRIITAAFFDSYMLKLKNLVNEKGFGVTFVNILISRRHVIPKTYSGSEK